ncbi:MAG: XRE family transcriptional regulator [Lachnospiraceae bacterium]|nr:XRE family transcriptional regulator [Lachnospiraceae bacterium]
MARGATKARGNVWCEARLEAAKTDQRLLTRQGAAERVNMSVNAISDTELGLEKCMPVDKAIILADAYGAPHLLNYYCLHECPIGRTMPISDEVNDIDRITVKLLKSLKVDDLEDIKDKLIDIAEDGYISEDEKPDLQEVMEYLDKLSKTVSELRILSQRVLREE